MNKDKKTAPRCTIPFTLHRGSEGWTGECKFCDFETETSVLLTNVEQQGYAHGKEKHYWWAADVYMNGADLEKQREHRRRFRRVMGNDRETANMNRMGL